MSNANMFKANRIMNDFEKLADIFKIAVLKDRTVMNILCKNSTAQLSFTGNVFSCKDASGNPMKLEYTVMVKRIK
jgi:hypothetical protein